MNPTMELVRLVQQEREARIRSDQLARLAARVRACCDLSRFDRFVRALRGSHAAS